MKTRPEFLSPRRDKPHPAKWEQRSTAPILGAVNAEWGAGSISASFSDSPSSQALQQYALIKARYGIDESDLPDHAMKIGLKSSSSLRIADQIATLATMKEMGELNKAIPTLNGKQVAQHYAKASAEELIMANCNLLMTGEHAKFIRTIKEIAPKRTVELITAMNKNIKRIIKTKHLCNTDESMWEKMTVGAYHRAKIAQQIERAEKLSKIKVETGKLETRYGARPELKEVMNGFHDLIVQKPNRTVGHSGRMGRSKKGEQFGRNLTRPHNYYGDNERKVFTRYKSGKGAVILLDLSGSMSLSEEEVDQMIESAHGSTIIGYSQGIEGEPNCWVIAHNNTRMKGTPDVRGGNGVDVPALLFADTYRKTKQPLVWVSDGYATGKNDEMSHDIMKATAKTVIALNVHQVIDVEATLKLLDKMQRGLNPKPEMCASLWHHLSLVDA
jgi:hypothetical protein